MNTAVQSASQSGRKFDLEERLLEFSARIVRLSAKMKTGEAERHVGHQLLRAGTSPYANHGEAEDAESANDFIHKMKICVKEMRETWRWLRLIQRVPLVAKPEPYRPQKRSANIQRPTLTLDESCKRIRGPYHSKSPPHFIGCWKFCVECWMFRHSFAPTARRPQRPRLLHPPAVHTLRLVSADLSDIRCHKNGAQQPEGTHFAHAGDCRWQNGCDSDLR